MSVKKTSSPLSSGAESLDQIGENEKLQSGKVEKKFEAALAELDGKVGQTESGEKSNSPTSLAFQKIAESSNLDSPEGAMFAVRQSARFLIDSSLGEDLKSSDKGEKILEDLSSYISKDPLMHRKILGILQRLK